MVASYYGVFLVGLLYDFVMFIVEFGNLDEVFLLFLDDFDVLLLFVFIVDVIIVLFGVASSMSLSSL